MAKILMVEDFYGAVIPVEQIIDQFEHDFVGYADSIQKTQMFLTKILEKELDVDVLLLDGNLGDNNPTRHLSYTFPLDGTEQDTKRTFRKPLPPQPREVTVYPEGPRFGADGRMIRKFMELCDIQIPTIGMSSDSMEQNGITVDYDLGKIFHPNQSQSLLAAIDTVLEK